MISGSDLGVPQTFGTACQLATKLEVKYKPRRFLAILVTIVTTPGLLLAALSPLQTQNTYLAPASGYCTVFKIENDFSNNYSKKIYAPSFSNTSFDMIQGGFFPAFNVYKSQIDGKRPKKWYKNFIRVDVDDYIGNQVQQLTYSTLAMGLGSLPDPTRKWDENFRKDKYNQPIDVTCPETKESPFDMYWAPDINTRHDSLLLGHVTRLRKEVIENLPWPKTQIQRSATLISTKSLLCPGESATVSISNPLPGMNYQWGTTHPDLTIISGQGTTTVTVLLSSSTNFDGALSVTCQAFTPCYFVNSLPHHFYINKLSIDGTYTAAGNDNAPLIPTPRRQFCVYNDACIGSYVSTNMVVAPGASITWSGGGTNNGDVVWWQVGNNLWFYFTGENQTASFNASTTNCGKINSVGYCFRSVNNPNCPIQMRTVREKEKLTLSISPNPSSDQIRVALVGFQEKQESKIYKIKILDKLGLIMLEKELINGSVFETIDVNRFKTDIYMILVYDGTIWYHSKFVKK